MALVHTLMIILLAGPIAFGLYGYFRSRKTPMEQKTGEVEKTSSWVLVANSAVLYALAYNLIVFIQELFLALGKRWLSLKAFLYHNNHGWEGDHPMTALAQGYGALAIFIAGWLFLGIFLLRRNTRSWDKMFFLWMSFQGFMQSIPQVFTAKVAPDTDVAQALAYLNVSGEVLTWLVLLSFICIIWVSLSFSRFLLEFTENAEDTNHPKSRFVYLFKVGLIASLLGAILIIPFRLPPFQQAVGPFMLALVSLPWVFANAWRVQNVRNIGNQVNQKILFLPVALLLLLLGIFQLVLAPGVQF